MVELLATGHSWSGGDGAITLAPVAGLLLTLMLARWSLGVRISPGMLGASVLLGTLFATAADTWGLTMAISGWAVMAVIIAAGVRHTRGPLGRNPSD